MISVLKDLVMETRKPLIRKYKLNKNLCEDVKNVLSRNMSTRGRNRLGKISGEKKQMLLERPSILKATIFPYQPR